MRRVANIAFTASGVTVSYDDGSQEVYSTVANVPPPPPPPPPPGPAVIRGGYFDYIPAGEERNYADEFGMSTVRLWFPIRSWGDRPGMSDSTFAKCRRLKSQGLSTLVVFTPIERSGTRESFPPPPSDPKLAYDYFRHLASEAGGCVDAWEIWNEPNLRQYNAEYGYGSWVTNTLAPAYKALKESGQFVVSGGWSGFPGDRFNYVLKKGLLDACDAVGHHPYGSNAQDQYESVRFMRSVIGSKPLWLTEWNLHMDASIPARWSGELVKAAELIRPLVQAVIHFRMVRNESKAGVAAPFNSDLIQTAFYEGTVAAMKVLA